MAETQPRVIIFDDFESGGQFIYRDYAAQAATAAGWVPEFSENVRTATRHLYDSSGEIGAVVTSLGRRDLAGFGYQFPNMPLISLANAFNKPLALLSGHPKAGDYIKPEAGDIVVPKQPYERIAPALHEWFSRLVARPV